MYNAGGGSRAMYVCSITLIVMGIVFAVTSITLMIVAVTPGVIVLVISLILIAFGIGICCYYRQKAPSEMHQGPVISGSMPPALVSGHGPMTVQQEYVQPTVYPSYSPAYPSGPASNTDPANTSSYNPSFSQRTDPSAPPLYDDVVKQGL